MARTMVIRKEYRFDEETDAALKQAVREINDDKNVKITESEYLRDLILRDRMDKMGVDRASFADIQRQLRGIGINVNQIAHRFNTGFYDMYDIEDLKHYMEEISNIKEQIDVLIHGKK